MKRITIGIIASPDLPAQIAGNLVEKLPEALEKYVDVNVSWKINVDVDPLTGAAEYISEVFDKAVSLKEENQWDYVICLTDLPSFSGKKVVTADARMENKVALISLPAFGAFPLKSRVKKAFIFLIDELYSFEEVQAASRTVALEENHLQLSSLKWRFLFSKIRRISLKTNKYLDVRFVLQSRIIGWLRVLFGMTFANRPWTALVSFKKVITLAFATGAYISIFSTPWELSVEYTAVRFILLMVSSIVSMVVWIIFAHNLWEKPSKRGKTELRKLYNITTVLTLFVIVTINYFVLFGLFLVALSIFVPPSLFDAWTNLQGEPNLVDYFRLAWLITSLGTLAGAIGATGEQESRIRHITYSYRQHNRYYEIEDRKTNNAN
ncbi:hypothetical protein ACLIBH_10820 [Virgibacillus sp. W0430]|uniref:hypothetical protein n=1 Tax=Virgibacillus sp. W0430 TaxID=3391580 RepID=UPI003F487FD9